MASADEIRRLLDDPNVAQHTKRELLLDLTAMLGADPDTLNRYARQLGVSEDEIEDTIKASLWEKDHRVRDPHGEHINQAHQDQELGRSWGNLTDSTPSPTSDAILDDGVVGLKIFDEFYPRFTRAGGTGTAMGGRAGSGLTGGQSSGVDPDSLRRAADELRGIDFRAFATDSSAVAGVVTGVDDSRNHLAQAWSTNLSGWTGPAAESANQYKAKFDGAVASLDAGIKPIPGALTTASQTIQKQVTDYAKHLHNQWGDGRMAGMTTEGADAVLEGLDKLPGIIAELEAKIRELNDRNLLERGLDLAAGVLGFVFGGPLGALVVVTGLSFAREITEDNIQEETEKYRRAFRACEQKRNQLIQDYTARASSVHEYTEQACQSVQETYDALFATTTGQGKLAANPFDAVGATPDFEDAGSDGAARPGPGGGGPGPGGGGPGPGGGYAPPPLPQGGTDPALAGAGATDPALAGGGGHPPGAAMPAGDPTDPRGQGAGVPPVPVGGGSGAGNGSAPGKAVTIKDGNRTITVGQPDARGRSRLTVDDGSGVPKGYDLDFGEDGTAVIHDGDATITAERTPGNPDQLKLSVDDGTPPPNSYTLDFDPAAPGSSSAGPGVSGAAEHGPGGGVGGSSGIGGGGGGGVGVPSGAGPAAGADGANHALDFGGATGAQSPGGAEDRPAAVAGGAPAGGGPGGQPGGAMGGMPMGGMGAGAGQGGDQTRTSKWRTEGKLFDEEDPAAHFDGVVGEDPGNRAKRA